MDVCAQESEERMWVLFKYNFLVAMVEVFSVLFLTLFNILSVSRLIMMLAVGFKHNVYYAEK